MAIIKHNDQRVGFFIDTQNLYHSAKNLYSDARVNFGAMVKNAVGGRKLVRALAPRQRSMATVGSFWLICACTALATPSGRIEIFSHDIDGFGYADCAGHPPHFHRRKQRRQFGVDERSQFGEAIR